MIPLAFRRRAASTLRAAGWKTRLVLIRLGRAVVELPDHVYDAAGRLSGIVSGCGCIYDDAEMCGEEWCECTCHGPLPGESDEDHQRRDGRMA